MTHPRRLTSLLALLVGFVPLGARADLTLTISDGTNSVTVTDNELLADSDPTTGTIQYNATLFGEFSVDVNGQSGRTSDPPDPELEIDTITVSTVGSPSSPPPTLTMTLTDSGFISPGGLEQLQSTFFGSIVNMKTKSTAGDSIGYQSVLLYQDASGNPASYTTGPQTFTADGGMIATVPTPSTLELDLPAPMTYALESILTFNLTNGSMANAGGTTVMTAPEPATLGLAATGAAALLAFGWARRRRRDASA